MCVASSWMFSFLFGYNCHALYVRLADTPQYYSSPVHNIKVGVYEHTSTRYVLVNKSIVWDSNWGYNIVYNTQHAYVVLIAWHIDKGFACIIPLSGVEVSLFRTQHHAYVADYTLSKWGKFAMTFRLKHTHTLTCTYACSIYKTKRIQCENFV